MRIGIHRQLAANVFVFRTDVESYYDSIDHDLLFDRLAGHVADAPGSSIC